MTQQSHFWAYTRRKPELKETRVPQHTEETKIERDTCTPVFIAALFIIARTWKQPRCPSADEWTRKLWYIYTMEYYSSIKKNTFESILMRLQSFLKIPTLGLYQLNEVSYQYSPETVLLKSSPQVFIKCSQGLECQGRQKPSNERNLGQGGWGNQNEKIIEKWCDSNTPL